MRLRRVRPLLAAGLLALAAGLSAAQGDPLPEELPPIESVAFDTIYLRDGRTEVGTIVDRRPDGSILWRGQDSHSGGIWLTRDQYQRYEERRSLAENVRRRGQMQLTRKDFFGIRKTIEQAKAKADEFGKRAEAAGQKGNDAEQKQLAQQQQDVNAVVLALAQAAMKADPGNTDVGDVAIALLLEQKREAEAEAVAKGILAANHLFEPAYETLAQLYDAQKRLDDLRPLLDEWSRARPSSGTANRLKAKLAEDSGDVRAAQAAYDKLFVFQKDPAAGIGFARASLRLGEYGRALKAAQALVAANQETDAANACLGIALLAMDQADAALAPLKAAVASGKLSGDLATWAGYDLGLAAWRTGARDEARAQWAKAEGAAGQLALAIVDHKPFAAAGDLPPTLAAVAQEYNAGLAIEQLQVARALSSLNPKGNPRHQFLALVAELLRAPRDEQRLSQLAAVATPESLRWQAYLLLSTQRWREAEAVLAKLPEDDGYAAAYRVYAAAGLNELPRARELYAKLKAAKDAPAAYVAVLDAKFAIADSDYYREDFAGPDGDVPPAGWIYDTPGTGIHIHMDKGVLALDGTQATAPDAVSRAYRFVPGDRLRLVSADLDLAAAGNASVGIEVLDEKAENGVAYAVLRDSKLGWRSLIKGQWGAWQELPEQVQGTRRTLTIEVANGRCAAVPDLNAPTRQPLGELPAARTARLRVGVFGAAEPGTAWKLAVDTMEVSMNKAAGGTRR